jgi:hypothetical protein
MKLRWLLLGALIVALSACSTKTTLRFENNTQCGTATISLTNTSNSDTKQYTITQGDSVSIDIKENVTYTYHLQYAGQPGESVCDPKDATIQVQQRGQTTIDLRSATATPNPTTEAG